MALENPVRPDRLFTVFAGQDVAATERARGYLPGYPPSSPSIALLRDGQLVMMMERKDIEGRSAHEVAARLRTAFDAYCAPQPR
jgi:putative YphP/YqiW family bacilliredoxin